MGRCTAVDVLMLGDNTPTRYGPEAMLRPDQKLPLLEEVWEALTEHEREAVAVRLQGQRGEGIVLRSPSLHFSGGRPANHETAQAVADHKLLRQKPIDPGEGPVGARAHSAVYGDTAVVRTYAVTDHIWGLPEEKRDRKMLADAQRDLAREADALAGTKVTERG